MTALPSSRTTNNGRGRKGEDKMATRERTSAFMKGRGAGPRRLPLTPPGLVDSINYFTARNPTRCS